jgi:hypothetical protein
MAPNSTASTSRRALLVASIGGIAAVAAQAFGRPSGAEAHDPDDVRLGYNNPEITGTQISNTTNDTIVFWGQSTHGGIGVYGTSVSNGGIVGSSVSGAGVVGTSLSSAGVLASSSSDNGVTASSASSSKSGVWGDNTMGGYGVSGSTSGASAAGVWGSNSGSGTGARGTATSGHGIHGRATSGYAGFFDGKVYTNSFFELREVPAPARPKANRARLFLKDNGSGKTQLCVKFSNGVVRILATM